MAEKNDLLTAMDDAARELLKSVNVPTMEKGSEDEEAQPVDMKSRIAAFAAVTDYLAVKHKIQPTGASKNAIDRYRSAINGGIVHSYTLLRCLA